VAASGENSNLVLPAVLITILTGLGIGAPLLKSSAPPPPPAHSTELLASSREASYPHSAADQILDFFDSNKSQFEDSDKPWTEGACLPSATQECPDTTAADYRIRFLIATLPDPDSVPLRYKFDTFLDAITEAADIAGFNLYSFDLPWLESARESSDGFKLAEELDIRPLNKAANNDRLGHLALGDLLPPSSLAVKPNDEHRSQEQPGILLFRRRLVESKTPPEPELLVAFLIGEQPTTGVNQTTLRSALNQIAWLSGWRDGGLRANNQQDAAAPEWLVTLTRAESDPNDRPVVYLLGPAYSASKAELNLTLCRWLYSFERVPRTPPVARTSYSSTEPGAIPQVIAVSGSASAVSNQLITDLNLEPPDHSKLPAEMCADGEETVNYNSALVPASYYSALVQDDELWEHVFSDLTNRPVKIDAISATGSSRSTPTVDSNSAPDIALLVPVDAPHLPDAVISHVLFIPYPTHISDVRTAFGKLPSEQGSAGTPFQHRDLSIADEAGGEEPDVVPAFSGRSAMYDELSLASTFATIHRERMRYVGIVADDVEDLVFLVRQLRLSCPDVTIFTTGADLRFLHSDVNADLEGMLVFSTYPLFSLNQRWTSRSGVNARMLQFPSDQAEGVFNASLKLLSGGDPKCLHGPQEGCLTLETMDYGVPFIDYSADESGADQRAGDRLPVLWESVVGHDALWPVSFHYLNMNMPAEARLKTSYQFALDWIPYPGPFKLGGFALMVLCFVPSFLFLSQADSHRKQSRLRQKIQRLLPRNPVWLHILAGPSDELGEAGEDNNIHEARITYLATFLIALLLEYMIWLAYFLLPILSGLELRGWRSFAPWTLWEAADLPFVFLALLTFLAVGAATFKAVKSAFRGVAASPAIATPWAFGKWLTLCAAIFVFGLGIGFITSLYTKPVPMQLFDFVRASHLWNGVSSLHPLLFVGFAGLCMAACDLRRLNLLQECRVKPSFLGFHKGALSFLAISKCEEEIVDRLECPFHRLPWGVLIEVLTITAGLYFILLRQWCDPLEGWWFIALFDALFLAVYLLFSRPLVRFASVWWSLRKFLRVLYWHPSRTAYEELRQKTAPDRPEAQHITLFEPRPSLAAMEASLTFARNLLQAANQISAKSSVANTLSNHLAGFQRELGDRLCETEAYLASAFKSEAYGSPVQAIRARREAQGSIARLSALVSGIFEPFWRTILGPSMPTPSEDEKELVESGKLFIAARVVDFLRQVFPQLLNLAGFSMVGALAMTLAVSRYPFPGRDTLLWFSWLVLLSVIVTLLSIFIQMNRDRVLSMLTGSNPGRLNWNSSFVLQLLVFGVVPVLTLLGAQFPHALSGMFSWIGGIFGGAK
jgi:hypothetical protein